MRNTDKIRLTVFKVWLLTLGTLLTVYATKFSGLQGPKAPFHSIFQSLQAMLGLVMPQIAIMAGFYLNLDRQEEHLEALSQPQIKVIVWLSSVYHLTFIATVIFGIFFQGFDSVADGRSLQRNTAAVMAIMGLFSLLLSPIAFLFTNPKQADRGPRRDPQSSH